jgi:hypothetical protein
VSLVGSIPLHPCQVQSRPDAEQRSRTSDGGALGLLAWTRHLPTATRLSGVPSDKALAMHDVAARCAKLLERFTAYRRHLDCDLFSCPRLASDQHQPITLLLGQPDGHALGDDEPPFSDGSGKADRARVVPRPLK